MDETTTNATDHTNSASAPRGLTQIVIATGNPHKVTELREMLALPGLEFVGLKDLPGSAAFLEPEETGTTFEANATIKALSYAEQTGLPCLADDSGLEVDALGGSPGVISSHYCTDGRETGMSRDERDAANNQKLMRELDGVELERRTARFVCEMVLASPETVSPSDTGGRAFHPATATIDGALDKHTGGDLPHWQLGGATYFVTFRLLQDELTAAERQIVCDACLYWHGQRLIMHVATIMPDHVHMVFRPLRQPEGSWPSLSSIMQGIKGYTSREINKARGVAGTLWQPEYHDRVLRTSAEIEQKIGYVQDNPVRAGFVAKPGEYRFTVRGERGVVVPEVVAAGWKARPPVVVASSQGTFEGRIGLPADVPRGGNGFGYDPLFLIGPEFDRTSAELEPTEKNRLSHRGDAAAKMLEQLRSLTARGLESPPP
jgi:putative transposase